MNILILAAAAVLGGQTTPAPAAPAAPLQVDIPPVAGVVGDPTCGARPALAQQATCVSTTQAAIGGVLDQYDAAFRTQGWLAADGRENLVIYVKRKQAGGCDAFQVLAFADQSGVAAPAGQAWLAFAAIPGDICTAPQAAAPAATPPAQ